MKVYVPRVIVKRLGEGRTQQLPLRQILCQQHTYLCQVDTISLGTPGYSTTLVLYHHYDMQELLEEKQ